MGLWEFQLASLFHSQGDGALSYGMSGMWTSMSIFFNSWQVYALIIAHYQYIRYIKELTLLSVT